MRQKLAAWRRELTPLLLGLILVFVVRTVAAEPYTVPSRSMVPTLVVGDKIIASKFAYGFSKYSAPFGMFPFEGRIFTTPPQRGDVIIFRLPRDTSETYVKRLIGLPGDHIQVREGRLYINGDEVPRRLISESQIQLGFRLIPLQHYIETLPNGREHDIYEMSDTANLDNTAEFEVPPDHYFMMGDNRDDSLDSRVAATSGGVGFVPAENLVGRADIVLYSKDPAIPLWDVWAWPKAFHRFFTRIG